jgi:hypothetical protein
MSRDRGQLAPPMSPPLTAVQWTSAPQTALATSSNPAGPAPITLRQGARVIEDSRRLRTA